MCPAIKERKQEKIISPLINLSQKQINISNFQLREVRQRDRSSNPPCVCPYTVNIYKKVFCTHFCYWHSFRCLVLSANQVRIFVFQGHFFDYRPQKFAEGGFAFSTFVFSWTASTKKKKCFKTLENTY